MAKEVGDVQTAIASGGNRSMEDRAGRSDALEFDVDGGVYGLVDSVNSRRHDMLMYGRRKALKLYLAVHFGAKVFACGTSLGMSRPSPIAHHLHLVFYTQRDMISYLSNFLGSCEPANPSVVLALCSPGGYITALHIVPEDFAIEKFGTSAIRDRLVFGGATERFCE